MVPRGLFTWAKDRRPLYRYDTHVRTPIRNPPDPMYAEIEVHRTMICDRVRTDAFRRSRPKSVADRSI